MWKKLSTMEQLLIASKILKKSNLDLIINGYEITDEMIKIAKDYLIEKKPLSKIFGKKNFYKSCFLTNEFTLDPRPETEMLVELVVKNHINDSNCNLVELGVGTGAVILSLLMELKNAKALATDISLNSLLVAYENAKNFQLLDRIKFIWSNWLDFNYNKENLILISNPPYLRKKEIKKVPELKFDPEIALLGSIKKFYKPIANKKTDFNHIYLEIHPNFHKELEKLFPNSLFHRDYNNLFRILEWHKFRS